MNETFIYSKIMDHDEKLITLERKLDTLVTRDEFDTRMDRVVSVLDRISNEQLVANHRLDNLESDVRHLKQDVALIKGHLGIVG